MAPTTATSATATVTAAKRAAQPMAAADEDDRAGDERDRVGGVAGGIGGVARRRTSASGRARAVVGVLGDVDGDEGEQRAERRARRPRSGARRDAPPRSRWRARRRLVTGERADVGDDLRDARPAGRSQPVGEVGGQRSMRGSPARARCRRAEERERADGEQREQRRELEPEVAGRQAASRSGRRSRRRSGRACRRRARAGARAARRAPARPVAALVEPRRAPSRAASGVRRSWTSADEPAEHHDERRRTRSSPRETYVVSLSNDARRRSRAAQNVRRPRAGAEHVVGQEACAAASATAPAMNGASGADEADEAADRIVAPPRRSKKPSTVLQPLLGDLQPLAVAQQPARGRAGGRACRR